MEPSKNPDPLCAAIEDEALRLYHPGNSRPHPVEWQPDPKTGRRFVGVSTLVKETAGNYAKRIIAAREEVDPDEGFWGEQGNALAEHHLRQLTPYRENQVRLILRATCLEHPDFPVIPRYPQLDDGPADEWDHMHGPPDGDAGQTFPCNGKTPGGWDMSGHFDAATVHEVAELGIIDEETDFRLAIREHKVQDPDEGEPGGNVDRATRQGLTYAGMADEMFRLGACFALQSALMGPGCRLVPLAPVELLALHFWPRTSPPARVMARRVQRWEKVKWLDFYCRKADCIIKSVETYEALVEKANVDAGLDLLALPSEESASKRLEFLKQALSVEGGAYSWDDSPEGVQEFKRTCTAIMAGLPTGPMRELVQEVVSAKASRDQWDVVARDREASAIALMRSKTDPTTGEPVKSLMLTEDDGSTEVAKATIVGGDGRASWLKVTQRTRKAVA